MELFLYNGINKVYIIIRHAKCLALIKIISRPALGEMPNPRAGLNKCFISHGVDSTMKGEMLVSMSRGIVDFTSHIEVYYMCFIGSIWL